MFSLFFFFFFFNDTATTEIYTLSLHDALPISGDLRALAAEGAPRVLGHLDFAEPGLARVVIQQPVGEGADRKSTRLNSSHGYISYAVFCLKKKKKTEQRPEYAIRNTATPHNIQ